MWVSNPPVAEIVRRTERHLVFLEHAIDGLRFGRRQKDRINIATQEALMGAARLDRRGLLAGIGVSMALAPRAQAQGGALAFLALGDWGQQGSPVQRRVAQAMGVTARAEACDFVVAAGDNFYPAGVASTDDPHWRNSFEDVYTAPALQVPWFAALGNHDYRGSAQAQVAYSQTSRRWRMPDRYFTVAGQEFGAPFVDLFVIDTSPMVDEHNYDELFQQLAHGHRARHERTRQLSWLDQRLAASTAKWKIVIGHHPVFSGGHGDTPQLVDTLPAMFEAHGVQAYINGHDHSLQHIRRGRVDYICTGSGAEANDALRSVEGMLHGSSVPGFAVFRLDADSLTFMFRDQDGAAIYQSKLEF